MPAPGPPIALLAELSHRCPLRCGYCSNPVELDRAGDELDGDEWERVLGEAAALGVLQVHFSGGEPGVRRDLETLVSRAAKLELYSNLITSGIGIGRDRLQALAARGLDHVQLSVQDAAAGAADAIAGLEGAHARKLRFARWVVEIGLPLTVNAVVHRRNVARVGDLIELALELRARRLEIAHVQYYGWARRNLDALLPTRDQVDHVHEVVAAARERLRGRLRIDYVAPDYHADVPKACMDGWGRRFLGVTPAGFVLPCQAAQTLPGLVFDNVRDRSLADIWEDSPAFEAFRGSAWMREPCRSCERRELDFGGCRCQAYAITGDAANADPVCGLSPDHARLRAIAAEASAEAGATYVYRGARSTAREDQPRP